MRLPVLAALVVLVAACGGSDPPPAGPPERAVVVAAPPPAEGGLEVNVELRRQQPGKAACAAGDACGWLLQLISPGSDPAALAEHAVKIARGKCSGRIIVYRDARHVMGAGIIVPTLEAKRACERALARAEDTDYPNYAVFRVGP